MTPEEIAKMAHLHGKVAAYAEDISATEVKRKKRNWNTFLKMHATTKEFETIAKSNYDEGYKEATAELELPENNGTDHGQTVLEIPFK
jgi:hypothetical protein